MRLSDSLAGAAMRLTDSLAGAGLRRRSTLAAAGPRREGSAADTTCSPSTAVPSVQPWIQCVCPSRTTEECVFLSGTTAEGRVFPSRTTTEERVSSARGTSEGDYLTSAERESRTSSPGMSLTLVKHSHTSRLKKPRLPLLSRSSAPTAFRHTGGRRVFDFSPPPTEVYVLELARGRVYVGKSGNVPLRRVRHEQGEGSAFTKAFKPTGVLLPRLGNVEGCGDAAERDETLRYMFMKGIQNVRGWKYTQVNMTSEEEQEAENNIRELFDLCRRCGMPGHFRNVCRSRFDRRGALCA